MPDDSDWQRRARLAADALANAKADARAKGYRIPREGPVPGQPARPDPEDGDQAAPARSYQPRQKGRARRDDPQQLSTALDGLLNPVTGRLQSIDQNFQDQISSYQKTIDQLQQEYNTRQDQLTQEFVNLETTLSSLKSVSSFLTAQTSALSSLSGSSSSKSSG